MRYFLGFLSTVLFLNCSSLDKNLSPFNKLEIETLVADSLMNIRALELTQKNVVAVSSLGDVYRYNLEKQSLVKSRFSKDTFNIRSIALVDGVLFSLSIGNPAVLYRDSVLVYFEKHPSVFYDSIDFWNSQEGIAMGDPTDGCISILITRDAGRQWSKIPCSQLPKTVEGEAAFAASDTNISIFGDKVWLASGGAVSRILYSEDKGVTWRIFNTPIVQGSQTTGIYSIDFYDEKNGIAVGGDYTNPKANFNTVVKTTDGGQTWQPIQGVNVPSYRSCVQFIPNSKAMGMVALGFQGIDYSADAGKRWKHLSDQGYYTIRFLNDSVAFAAGSGRISKLSFK